MVKIENIILYIIYPIIVSIFTLLINNKIDKMNKLKKEFFYEFEDLYLETHRAKALNFTDLDKVSQDKFINLILKNVKYAKGILAELFGIFIMSISTEEASDELNRIFNEISEFVFDKTIKRRNKIGIIEYCKYKRIIKNRNDEDNKIFYITNISKDGIHHSDNEKISKNI